MFHVLILRNPLNSYLNSKYPKNKEKYVHVKHQRDSSDQLNSEKPL